MSEGPTIEIHHGGGSWAIAIMNGGGGLRITPEKCWGGARTVKSWPLDLADIARIRMELNQCARTLRKNTKRASK